MGQQLIIKHRPECPVDELKERVRRHQRCDFSRVGGRTEETFPGKGESVQVFDHIFESVAQAEEWISNKNSRMEPLYAVRAKEKIVLSREELGAGYVALQEKAQELSNQRFSFTSKVIREDAAKLKSTFITCAGCKSKFNREAYLKLTHFETTSCPLCRTNLLEKPVHARARERLQKQLAQVHKDMEAFQDKRRRELGKATPQILWLVGGWCGETFVEPTSDLL